MSENTMELTAISRKATLNAIGFDIDALRAMVAENPKMQEIVNVYALVTAYKREPQKNDTTKTTTRFTGQFRFVNRLTGEQLEAIQGFFPGVVEAYLESLKDQAGDGAVQTAFIITVEFNPDKKASQPYKFGLRALVNKAEDANPFAALEKLLPMPKAIAAPKDGKGKK